MKIVSTLLLAALLFTSCKKESPASDPVKKKIAVKGKVQTTNGEPLAAVRIYLDHQTLPGKSVMTTSDSNGQYVALLDAYPEGTWKLHAQLSTTFNGRSYDFRMDPENMLPVGPDGGIRNFVWKLKGTIPGDPDQRKIGGYVNFRETSDEPVAAGEVELTLVPAGPMVDGSAGERIIGFGKTYVVNIPGMYSNFSLEDVPVAVYKVSAQRVTAAGMRQEMELREYGSADYTATVTAGFFQTMPSRFQQMALDIRLKK